MQEVLLLLNFEKRDLVERVFYKDKTILLTQDNFEETTRSYYKKYHSGILSTKYPKRSQ